MSVKRAGNSQGLSRVALAAKRARDLAMAKIMQELSTYLYAAKVQFVHELVGVPVEVTLIDDRMSSFRIVESEVIL